MTIASAGKISFELVNPDNSIDTLTYTNLSGSAQSITTALTNLKAYFDSGTAIDVTNAAYSIDGTKNSIATGTLGLFSDYDFTYSVAANSQTASFSFTGKTNGAITGGALSNFQIRDINLFSNWGNGEPNNAGNEDFANFSDGSTPQYAWNDLRGSDTNDYVIEYNTRAGSAVLADLKRDISLPIPGVIEVGNPASAAVGNALNYANFSGALTGFSSVVSGSQVILTSSTAGSNVDNISSSFVNRAASSSGILAIDSSTTGTGGTKEVWTFNFSGLKAGDAVTVTEASAGGSITFTAKQDLTAEKVAQAFAGIAARNTKASNALGTFSGTNIASYASGLADGSKVTFTASVIGDAANLSGAIVGRSASTTTNFSTAVVTNGGAAAQESVKFKFPPTGIKLGDSVRVGGLTFTASRSLTTAEISAAFASLANNATTGAGSSYGSYTGSLSGYTSGTVIGSDQVLFTSIAASGVNVDDLTASSVIKTIAGTGITVNQYTTARNAQLNIAGIAYERSNNAISDIYSGVTFNLMGTAGTTNVKVILGTDNTEKSITGLRDAYNDLIKSYNSMTANSANSKTPGTFATNPTTLSFIEGIKNRLATGLTYNIGTNNSDGDPYRLSLASLGLDYQLDGTLKYNAVTYLMSQSAGLRDKFLKGIKIGYASATDNLMSFVKAQSSSLGALSQEIKNESNQITSLTKEKENIQNRLNKVQESYISQYSGLNALLFQLNSTSTSLGSALDSLTNMNSKK
jgi:flagellar capping protein FliD